jgi:toxin ParE1/3/4
MSDLIFSPQADQDLAEIWDFIAQDNIDAADRVCDDIEQKCQALAQAPGIGRARDELAPSLRSFPVGKYIIFYRFIVDAVEITRILHGARDLRSIFE